MNSQNYFFENRGIVLVTILVFLLVIGVIITLTWSSVTRAHQHRSLKISATLQQNEVARSAVTKFAQIAHGLAAGNDASVHKLKSEASPILELHALKSVGSVNSSSGVLFSYLGMGEFQYPDWSFFGRAYRNGDSRCDSLDRQDKSPTPPYSFSVCRQLDDINGDLILRSDLIMSLPLHLTDLRDEDITIAVFGQVELRKSLTITNSSNVKIEILALGPLLIQEVVLDTSSNIQVELHSSRDRIEVSTWPAEQSPCSYREYLPQLAISSPREVILGEQRISGPIQLGCQFDRNPLHWPTVKLLGIDSDNQDEVVLETIAASGTE